MASLGALRLSESAASAQVAETNVGGGSVVASSTPLLPPQLAAASGAIQGAAQNLVKQLVLHPLDTIKTRVQMPSELSRAELFRDLYRGLIPTIVGGTPGSSAFFAAKEAMTSVLKPRGLPPQVVTVAGVVAGVLSAKSIKTPFDVAQTRGSRSRRSRGMAPGRPCRRCTRRRGSKACTAVMAPTSLINFQPMPPSSLRTRHCARA